MSQEKAICCMLYCSRATIVQFSAEVVCFAAFLRQPCNKAQGYLAVVLRLSLDKCVGGYLLHQSYEYLACRQQSFGSLACLAAFFWPPEIAQNRKENEHVENLVFDVAAALRPCFFRKAVLLCCRTKTRNLSSQTGAWLPQG